MKQEWRIAAKAFLQGFTVAGSFEELDIPEFPTRMFRREEDDAESDELLSQDRGVEDAPTE